MEVKNAAITGNENAITNADRRTPQAVPVTSQIPILQPQLLPPQQIVMGVYGQQFILIPFNQGQGQLQVTPIVPTNIPAFNTGRNQNRGQLRGRDVSNGIQATLRYFCCLLYGYCTYQHF